MVVLLFSVNINELGDDLSPNSKLFAKNTSLLLVIYDIENSAIELNNDFYQINKRAFQWKMSFIPDPSKQAKKYIFSRKTENISHPSLRFNNNIISKIPYQKHIGIFLDAWLTLEEHFKVIPTKVNKTIGMFWKLQKSLSWPVLMTM